VIGVTAGFLLQAINLTVGYGSREIIRDVSLDLKPGQFTVLIGPNGSGKTTLLKALARLLPLRDGVVTLAGRTLGSYSQRELARSLAVLPQIRQTPALKVSTLISQGRYPHHRYFSSFTADDQKAIAEAMATCKVCRFANREMNTLSGGERQRVFLAMLLAQDAELMILDEPTTFLDIAQQLEVLDLLRSLSLQGKTILAVIHDVSLALRYADRILLLDGGCLVDNLPPDELITSGLLEKVYGVNLHRHAADGMVFTNFSVRKDTDA